MAVEIVDAADEIELLPLLDRMMSGNHASLERVRARCSGAGARPPS